MSLGAPSAILDLTSLRWTLFKENLLFTKQPVVVSFTHLKVPHPFRTPFGVSDSMYPSHTPPSRFRLSRQFLNTTSKLSLHIVQQLKYTQRNPPDSSLLDLSLDPRDGKYTLCLPSVVVCWNFSSSVSNPSFVSFFVLSPPSTQLSQVVHFLLQFLFLIFDWYPKWSNGYYTRVKHRFY